MGSPKSPRSRSRSENIGRSGANCDATRVPDRISRYPNLSSTGVLQEAWVRRDRNGGIPARRTKAILPKTFTGIARATPQRSICARECIVRKLGEALPGFTSRTALEEWLVIGHSAIEAGNLSSSNRIASRRTPGRLERGARAWDLEKAVTTSSGSRVRDCR
jgi:hypothetical protein